MFSKLASLKNLDIMELFGELLEKKYAIYYSQQERKHEERKFMANQKKNYANSNNRNGQKNNTKNSVANAKVQTEQTFSKAKFLPLLLLVIFVPLITILRYYDSGLGTEDWFSAGGELFDFFLYYRSRFIIIMGVILLVMLVYYFATKKVKLMQDTTSIIVISSLVVYMLFALFSVLFAKNAEAAVWGGFEQFEGIFVVLTYGVIFFFVYSLMKNSIEVKYLLYALIIVAFIVGLLGVFQAMKMDYIKSDWMRPFLTMLDSRSKNVNISLNFEEGMVYSTLYNPNYVGTFAALFVPVTVCAVFVLKNIVFRIMAALSAVMIVISLFYSQSFTGMIGLLTGVVLVVIFYIPHFKKNLKLSLIAIGAIVLVGVMTAVVKPELISSVLSKFTSTTISDGNEGVVLDGAYIKKDELCLTTVNDATASVKLACPGLIVCSPAKMPEGANIVQVEGTQNYQVYFADKSVVTLEASAVNEQNVTYPALNIIAGKGKWTIVYVDGKYKCYNDYHKFAKLDKVEHAGFKNSMTFATNRGYIWSRTFPLLLENIIVGSGRDNFVYSFPNGDYVGKTNYGFGSQVITKPHNMYLQIWVEDGLFALLGFLAIVLFYVIDCFKTYFRKSGKGFLFYMGIAFMIAVISYMTTGIANDVTITVAPVFFAVMAAGFVINRIVKKQMEEKNNKAEPEVKNKSSK